MRAEIPLCQTCDGSGHDGHQDPNREPNPRTCPECGGSGWNITDGQREFFKELLEGYGFDLNDYGAKMFVVAVFDYLKENQPKATHTNYNTGEQCFCDQKEQQ